MMTAMRLRSYPVSLMKEVAPPGFLRLLSTRLGNLFCSIIRSTGDLRFERAITLSIDSAVILGMSWIA